MADFGTPERTKTLPERQIEWTAASGRTWVVTGCPCRSTRDLVPMTRIYRNLRLMVPATSTGHRCPALPPGRPDVGARGGARSLPVLLMCETPVKIGRGTRHRPARVTAVAGMTWTSRASPRLTAMESLRSHLLREHGGGPVRHTESDGHVVQHLVHGSLNDLDQ